MSKENLYLQVMRDYFEYNSLVDDTMEAFKNAAPDAFKDFCKEQITSSYDYSEFIDKIDFFADYDKEMLDFTLELYSDKVDEEDIKKCWRMYTNEQKEVYVVKTFDDNYDSLYAVMSDDKGTALERLTGNINEATVFYEKDDADTIREELDDTRLENFTVSTVQDAIEYDLYNLPANETFTIEDWNGHKGINIVFRKDEDFYPNATNDDYPESWSEPYNAETDYDEYFNIVQISVTANGKEITYTSDIHVDDLNVRSILDGDFNDFCNTDKSLEDIVSNAEKENEIER